MKKMIIVIVCIGGLLLNAGAVAQNSGIIEIQTHNVFKGIFLSIWAKLKALNPPQKQSAKSISVGTIGIRGAEATETLLKPYWKDDLTQDKQFQVELAQFYKAQKKLDSGELNSAIEEFDQFLNKFSNSVLRPNALFSKGISLAGIGKNESSIVSMKQFIDENPNHPLVSDAKMVISELSG